METDDEGTRSCSMDLFFLRFCDRTGHALRVEPVEAGDLYAALAQANGRLRTLIELDDGKMVDPKGRINVEDWRGSTVAQVVCGETIAAMSLGSASRTWTEAEATVERAGYAYG